MSLQLESGSVDFVTELKNWSGPWSSIPDGGFLLQLFSFKQMGNKIANRGTTELPL